MSYSVQDLIQVFLMYLSTRKLKDVNDSDEDEDESVKVENGTVGIEYGGWMQQYEYVYGCI